MSGSIKKRLKALVNTSALRLASECRLKTYLDATEDERKIRLFSFCSRNITEVFYNRMSKSGVMLINLQEPFADLQPNIEHRSKRRKVGQTFEEIKTSLADRYDVFDSKERTYWFKQFDQILSEYESYFRLAEIFLDLQFFLQEPYELLVLIDRHQFLIEHGIDAELMVVFPAEVSPRNVCIVAQRIKISS
jgi:hypothetical protein